MILKSYFRTQFIFIITLIFSVNITAGQEIRNELKHQLKWDIGILGTWLNYEMPIKENWTLIAEIGVNPVVFGGQSSNSAGTALAGRISLAPMFYYNRQNRVDRNLNISNNSGNYISMTFDYVPSYLTWSSNESRAILPEVRIIPTWGLRRNFYRNWMYEGKFGIGYSRLLNETLGYKSNSVAFDIRFSIGYVF